MELDLGDTVDFSKSADGLGSPRILVIGCGGAGGNTISRLKRMGFDGARCIAINTDRQHLESISADCKMLIGKKLTRGMGAGGDPEVGRRAAESARTELEDLLRGADLVFVLAGMGGGTGTGAAPVLARIARQQGALVIAMVTTPFHVERKRIFIAEEGLEDLRNYANTSIVMDNNRLLQSAPHLPFQEAFSLVDGLAGEIIQGICETLTCPSLINLDYADVHTIMNTGGASYMLVGGGSMKKSPEMIVRSALKNPLLDVDLRGAKGCLLHISGGPDMTLKEAAAIASNLTQDLDPEANVIWGARIKPELRGRVRLMAIITGVKSAQVLGPAGEEADPLEGMRLPASRCHAFTG
ncbi:cell division protein FtsZ [Methanothrix sp.]|uniref:cell division protein FtsZ n=1 Tax=Methanothrix sp. TaxID=90426 RepID=UPI003C76EE7F